MEPKKIEEILKDHEERINKLELALSSQKDLSQKSVTKEPSLKEFILDKVPKGGYQIGLTIAYFLERYQKVSSFTSEDLENAFREAKIKPPSNISDIIYRSVQRGLIMESKERKNNKKSYVVTNTGEKFVETAFEKANKS